MVFNLKRPETFSALRLPLAGHGMPRQTDVAAASIRDGSISTPEQDAKIDAVLGEMDALLKDKPSDARHRWARRKDRALRQKRNVLKTEFAVTAGKINRLNDMLASYDDLDTWASGFLTFQKPNGSVFQEFRKSIADENVIDMHDVRRQPNLKDYDDEVFENANIFVLEHDWVSAVGRAEEFKDGSFRLPYDTCIFEFTVTGKRVMAIACNYSESAADKGIHNEIVLQIGVKSLVGWAISPEIYRHSGSGWSASFFPVSRHGIDDPFVRLVTLIGDQMRAACIALDADVAAEQIVRMPNAGTERGRGDLPEYEYRLLSLAKRARAPMLLSDGTGTKRRMHFRRGHWRHFETHKTWVRWHMVGDPDIGFIEKDYRL